MHGGTKIKIIDAQQAKLRKYVPPEDGPMGPKHVGAM
jgi:hypothetical protein